jgi:hypothetical protein
LINIVHVTHEAVHKVGGIGTVLEGLINSAPYRDGVGRTVLVCPLFYPEEPSRLGPGGIIEYSSLDQLYGSPYSEAFRRIEHEFHVRIVYGQRPLEDEASARRTMCEVLLVDLRGISQYRVNELKGLLWEHYGIQSHRYEHVWEYEQYIQLAAPAAAALEVMHVGGDAQPAVALAHEFMGIPTALALTLYFPRHYRSLFHAHEVATVRRIVEQHPGHDVMFYNALELARKNRLYLEDVFGPQHDYFKHALVEAARYCDGTLAVGHHVLRELQFMGRKLEESEIHLAFNGVPSAAVKLADRQRSRAHLRDYCEALLGWRPDWIFTHVTRLAVSKALWRDLDVLAALDPRLAARGETAVLLVLSTELPRRAASDVLRMEREWDWPLAHREGPPDLTGGEAAYYQLVQAVNLRSRAVRVVYINQFGLNAALGGDRVPDALEFLDLRRGSDLEFGLSLYEPFGISPFEPLTFGGLCAVSTSCGCVGFLQAVTGDGRKGSVEAASNVLLADYISAGVKPRTVKDAIEIDAPLRREAEHRVAELLADEIAKRLPRDEAAQEALLKSGYELARRMSWDAVAERFIFPAMHKAVARRRILSLA